ncbi:TRAP transporter large permease [Paractinoplanes hotanensis]|uniref:TRAP transporter large permease n=1 Tax=Paractinoplanes hotanensis TaxID=2906497 RepID=A0ABT0YBI2_9ACTN|nr:TRAP transporter large permease [Actinoplanes hotanensis]MCM4083398.1 TRAP transporter large permease [Actinoplanes hotanensis]
MILELWMVGAIIALLLFIRVPVALAFIGPSLWYAIADGRSSGFALKTTFDGLNSFPLLAVPLFILVGVLANRIGIADRLYEFCLAALGRLRGNLAYVNVGSAVGFSWMSGSALADVAGLGKMQIPAMVKAGYPAGFAAGLTASSSLISPVMPPSIPAVIYAATATVSTGALFAASVLPAFAMAAGLCIYILLWTMRRPQFASVPFDRSRFTRAAVNAVGPLLTPVILLGGILSGTFTPTEAAAVAVLYMLILGLIYRSATPRLLLQALRETAVITAGITLILGAAALLGLLLTRAHVSRNIAEYLTAVTESPWVFMILVNIILLILGALIDATAVILVTVPVLLPIAMELGVDPVYFGVVMIMNLMIGLLTPPVGSVLYITSSVIAKPVDVVFRGVAPFLIPLVAVLILVTALPGLVLWLPGLLGF